MNFTDSQENHEKQERQGCAQLVLEQIRKGPTPFHVAANIGNQLEQYGFVRLLEEDSWDLKAGGRYYVCRNDSAVISFVLPQGKPDSFRMCASHSDSPCFKIKESPELKTGNAYIRLNTELYGGAILYSFMDRPLRIAGRVMVQDADGRIQTVLVDLEDQTVVIPSLAIHFNREVNRGYEFQLQKDTLPLYAGGLQDTERGSAAGRLEDAAGDSAAGGLLKRIAAKYGLAPEQILASDLSLTAADPGSIWGAQGEFLSSPRLDDQECVYGSLYGFLEALEEKAQRGPAEENVVLLHAVFDNEEVGSGTRQGAASTFLRDVLERICVKTGLDAEARQMAVARSFLISADNAQALHPNHSEKSDPVNAPVLNGGIVLKFNASQKYATDAVSAAVVRSIAKKAGVPCQDFANRSDIRGGSTLGTIADTVIPVRTADIGLAQLAMHSAYETAGTRDVEFLVRFMKAFYE